MPFTIPDPSAPVLFVGLPNAPFDQETMSIQFVLSGSCGNVGDGIGMRKTLKKAYETSCSRKRAKRTMTTSKTAGNTKGISGARSNRFHHGQ
jgi:hypothetical protein